MKQIAELSSLWESKSNIGGKGMPLRNVTSNILKVSDLLFLKDHEINNTEKSIHTDKVLPNQVDLPIADSNLALNAALKNREPELKTFQTGKNVSVSNSNRISKSRACLIQ